MLLDVWVKGMQSKIVKSTPCRINGSNKKPQTDCYTQKTKWTRVSHAVNVSAATINQSNQVTSFLQIVPVSVRSGSNRLTTYAFLDSGSTVSFIDQSVQGSTTSQRHGRYIEHSWHIWDARFEDRECSYHNKGT